MRECNWDFVCEAYGFILFFCNEEQTDGSENHNCQYAWHELIVIFSISVSSIELRWNYFRSLKGRAHFYIFSGICHCLWCADYHINVSQRMEWRANGKRRFHFIVWIVNMKCEAAKKTELLLSFNICTPLLWLRLHSTYAFRNRTSLTSETET